MTSSDQTNPYPPRTVLFLGLTALCFVIFRYVVPVGFKENDDTVMMMLANGALSGTPSPNLVFMNYGLGWLFSALYSLRPEWPWYPSLLLLGNCAALSLLVTAFLSNWKTMLRTSGISFITLCILFVAITVQMQFTTAAALTAAIGVWAVIHFSEKPLKAVGALLVMFGLLLRFEAGALAILVSTPLICLALFKSQTPRLNFVILLSLAALGVAAEHFGQSAKHAVSPEYFEYNTLRGGVNDNGAAFQVMARLPDGVSENDYRLFLEFFPDPTVINLQKLTEIRGMLDQVDTSLTVGHWGAAVVQVLQNPPVSFLVIALILLALTATSPPDRILFLACILTLVLPLAYVTLTALLKGRVVIAAAGPVLVSMLFTGSKNPNQRLALTAQLPLVAITLIALHVAIQRTDHALHDRSVFLKQVEVLDSWPGQVVPFKNHFRIEFARLFTDDIARISGKPVMSGWLVLHPDNSTYTGHDILLREDTALLLAPDAPEDQDDVIAMVRTALKENYGVETVATVVAENERTVLVTFRSP